MQQLDSDLWIVDSRQGFVGLEIGTRMTVVRLPDSALLLHSPVPVSDGLKRQLEELGRVTYLVAPNCFHHLYAGDWLQAFPEASLYAAPGLERKRPDLKITGVLGDTPEPGWNGVLDQVLVNGLPLVNEVAFYHATRSFWGNISANNSF